MLVKCSRRGVQVRHFFIEELKVFGLFQVAKENIHHPEKIVCHIGGGADSGELMPPVMYRAVHELVLRMHQYLLPA